MMNRPVVQVDEAEAAAYWEAISKATDEIYRKNSSNLSYGTLYSNANNLVQGKHGEFLYGNVKKKITEHLLIALTDLKTCLTENLLSTLSEKWEHHKISVFMVKDILMYLDYQYAVQQKVLTVYNLGLTLFRDLIVYDIDVRQRLQTLLITSIQEERKGNYIDQNLVRENLSMLSDISIDNVKVYDEEFETPFLDDTRTYYKNESLRYLDISTIPEYLVKAQEKLNEEAKRVDDYLSKSSESRLSSLVENELLQNHCKFILDSDRCGVVQQFNEDRYIDLQRMYMLFVRVPFCADALKESMGIFVKEKGLDIVKEQELKSNPVEFIEKLFILKGKFDAIIEKSFNSDPKFSRRLKEALESVLNQETKCSNYLALYADFKLKKKEEDSNIPFEEVAEKLIIMFRFLLDKDLFEGFYRKFLAKRLLFGTSSSFDNERIVVSKLKAECGNQFTAKLEGMLTDMALSKTVADEYRETNACKSCAVELELNLLTNGHWPSSTMPDCVLAPELRDCQDNFTKYYLSNAQASGRKLAWHVHMGSVDVKGTFKRGPIALNVSAYQACILVLFNSKATLSLEEIHSAMSGIDEQELHRHLLSMCTPKYKILIKSSTDKDIQESDEFTFNEDFSSKFRRITIPLIVGKNASSEESHAVSAAVEEERKIMLEAAIVRIMKARKTLAHNSLVEEIHGLVSSRFNPKPAAMKSRIESLIGREYLKRDDADPRIYVYVA